PRRPWTPGLACPASSGPRGAGAEAARDPRPRLQIDAVVVDRFDVVDREGVVHLVRTVRPRQLDRVAVHFVYRADVLAVAVGHFHVFLDAHFLEHDSGPFACPTRNQRRPAGARSVTGRTRGTARSRYRGIRPAARRRPWPGAPDRRRSRRPPAPPPAPAARRSRRC